MSYSRHYFEDGKDIENYHHRMLLLVCPGVKGTKIPLIMLLHHDDTEDNSEDPESQC